MTLVQAVKTCLTTKYVDFKGRADRSEFWWFTIFYYAVLLILIVPLIRFSIMMNLPDSSGKILSAVFLLIYMIAGFAMALPRLAVMVRRLHDIGKSGWWLFINCIPWIGGIIFFVLLLMPSKNMEAEEVAAIQEKEFITTPSLFTLPTTIGLMTLFTPFLFWLTNWPLDMLFVSMVAVVVLAAGVFLAVWKKLNWPKDKWLWIATAILAVLMLAAAICRLTDYYIPFLKVSLIFLYPMWTMYFGIRFWQANMN